MMREIYISMKPLWKVINIYMCADTYTFKHIHIHTHTYTHTHSYTHTHTHIHIHIHIYIYMYMYMYMYMCVCVCECVCVWEREGREGRRADSLRSVPQQLHQALRMFGGIGNVLLSRPVLKLKMGKIHWFLVVNL